MERARGIAEFLLGPLSAADGAAAAGLARRPDRATSRFADDYGAVVERPARAAGGDRRAALAARGRAARPRWRSSSSTTRADGGFYLAPVDGEALVARTKNVDDNPTPSANALAGGRAARARAASTATPSASGIGASGLRIVRDLVPRLPHAFGRTLALLDAYVEAPQEIAVVGPPGPARDALVAEASRHLLPHAVLVVADPAEPGFDDVPLLAGKTAVDGAPAAYVCERFACRQPVTSAEELAALLG